jgi:PAS domain-containing protein
VVSLVLLTTWSQDRDRQPQQLDDVLARVARVSPVPVYGVGGSMAGFSTSEATLREAHQQGEAAGALAAKILQGVPPSEIPIEIVRSASSLEPVSLRDAVPPPATVAPGPRPTPAAGPLPRPWFLALVAVTVSLQTALIVMLFLVLWRQRQTRRDLEAARQRTVQIADSADLAVLEWDIVTGRMAFNARYAERLGYLPEDVPPTRSHWESMVHADDLPAVRGALQECLDDQRTFYALRYRLLTRAGTYRWVRERGEVTARLADGSPGRLLGVQMDGEVPPDQNPDAP